MAHRNNVLAVHELCSAELPAQKKKEEGLGTLLLQVDLSPTNLWEIVAASTL